MSDLGIVPLLIGLCQEAIKGVKESKKKKLSETEKELLIAAKEKGEFLVLSVDEVPDWVLVGEKHFSDNETNDPQIAIKYMEAFKNLCNRGYISFDGGHQFMLTVSGFKKARALAA